MARDGYRFLAPPLALGIIAAVLGLVERLSRYWHWPR